MCELGEKPSIYLYEIDIDIYIKRLPVLKIMMTYIYMYKSVSILCRMRQV